VYFLCRTIMIAGTIAFVLLALFALYLKFLLSFPMPATSIPSAKVQNFFAYGANINPAYLGKIRDVRISQAMPAYTVGYRRTFAAAGFAQVEPAYSCLEVGENYSAEGVLYKVHEADLAKLSAGKSEQYRLEKVLVNTADTRGIEAWALTGGCAGDAQTPSRRYLQMLVAGAKENGLSSTAIADLKAEEGLHVRVLSDIIGIAVIGSDWWNARFAR